jgi:hypothetical protein
MAKCDWYDGTLSVVLPEDPERIAVRLFDSRLAPARLYVPEVETLTLRDENAKLREELAKARDPQRIGGQADPSSFVYAIEQLREFRWQHATNDEDAIPYINNVAAAHERESAELRELVAQRTAKRVIVSNADTDHATGHCACGACGGAIDPWDAWCRHCGANLEEDA